MTRLANKLNNPCHSMWRGFLFSLLGLSLTLVLSGCDESAPPATPAARCQKTSNTQASLALADSASTTKTISFENDILPILSSTKEEDVYKCTTCHASYKNEATFSDKAKIDNMVLQLEEKKMPLNGDEMRKEYIELIKNWRDQKFPTDKGDSLTNNSQTEKPVNWEDEDQKRPSQNTQTNTQPTNPSSGCSGS